MSNKSNKYSSLIKIFKKKKNNIMMIIRWMKKNKNDDKNDAS